MSIKLTSTMCCGLRLMSGITQINDTKKNVLYMLRRMYEEDYDCAFVIYSCNDNNPQAVEAMNEFILKNKLGKIKGTSHNGFRAYIYEVNQYNACRYLIKTTGIGTNYWINRR